MNVLLLSPIASREVCKKTIAAEKVCNISNPNNLGFAMTTTH
jgi:hypothetical protein